MNAPRGRFRRLADVVADLSVSESTIYRWLRSGEFPPKSRLSQRCTGWWERDLEAWKAARAAEPPPPDD